LKRKTIIGIALVLILAIAVPFATAATDDKASGTSQAPAIQGPYTLTDEQKKEVQAIYDKILEANKQLVQKYADFGKITKEQADYMIKRMEEKQKNEQKFVIENGFGPGFGPGFRGGHKRGFGGGRGCWGAPQTAPQSDTADADKA
jgi:hypothetical protein